MAPQKSKRKPGLHSRSFAPAAINRYEKAMQVGITLRFLTLVTHEIKSYELLFYNIICDFRTFVGGCTYE